MIAIKPALIVTLISKNKSPTQNAQIIRHLARLEGGLALQQFAPDEWYDREEKILAVSIMHPQLDDVAFVQLAINSEGEVAKGWRRATERVTEALAGLPEEANKALLGRTLIYQATLQEEGTADEAQPDELLQELLHELQLQASDGNFYNRALAASNVPGGRLWLLQSAIKAQTSVYVALGKEKSLEQLNYDVLLGEDAALLWPDAVAHKAYFMMRQYQKSGGHQKFSYASNSLMKQTVTILQQQEPSESIVPSPAQPISPSPHHALATPSSESLAERIHQHIKELNHLNQQVANLTSATASLRQLHSHLKIHRFNYQISLKKSQDTFPPTGDGQRRATFGQIGLYHRQQLNNSLYRINEDLTDANAALAAANTAINSLRAKYQAEQAQIAEQQRLAEERHAKQREKGEQRTQDILATVGVALSVAQMAGNLDFLAQGIIILVAALCTWYGIQWLREKRN